MSDIGLLQRIYRRFKYLRSKNLRGCLDGLRGSTICGWAQDISSPLHRPLVEVLEAGRVVASGRAQTYRGDLKEQGIGDGTYGFEIVLPRSLVDGQPHRLTLRVDRHLELSPGGILFQEQLPTIPSPVSLPGEPTQPCTSELTQVSAESASLADGLLNRARERYLQKFARVSPEPSATLSFAEPEAPLASIVIPAHNKFDLTWRCLNSLATADVDSSFELVLVDDGSSDATTQVEQRLQGVKLVRHETAHGFVGSCNDGAALARGRFIVFLNNDTELTHGWLDELLWPFHHLPHVGLVGGQLIYPDGRLQESGGIFWSDGSAWNYGRNDNALHPRFNYTRDVDYASGACIAVPSKLWKALNGFDEIFAPGYYEDSDLAFRIRKAGFRTLVAPLCKVYHREGGSAGTDLSAGMKRFQAINEPKFRERWKDIFPSFGSPGGDPDLEKDRGVTKRALVLDALTPRPDRDAGSYAAIQEMHLLQSLGFKLSFAAQNLLYDEAYTDALLRKGIEVLLEPYYRSFREILEARGREFNLIYVTRDYVADTMIDDARRFAPQAKVVMNNADLHFLREMRAAVSSNSDALMQRALATREVELSVMRKVDLVLSYNEIEHAVILSHNGNHSKVAKAPWIVDVPYSVPTFESRSDIAFLGSFGHPPNLEAVHYFVESVMPLLRQLMPGLKFRIYGSGVTEEVTALAAEDVIIEGFVESVAQVYDSCRVFVVPLLSGAGLKGKLIGALAHGVPSVVSPIAQEGSGTQDGVEVEVASTPALWADTICRLMIDEKRWNQRSRASRRFAARHYSAEAGLALMRKALQSQGLDAIPPSRQIPVH